MMMFFAALCKVLPHTSSALGEIMPAQLTAETFMFWEKSKSCLPSHAFRGLL
jgi:hypothetical protein